MASGGRLPHLLRSNLSLPPSKSLVVLTSVINASTNWLLLRFLLCLDINAAANQASGTTFASKIVLVSFLRDWEFWRDGARRIVSLDASRYGILNSMALTIIAGS